MSKSKSKYLSCTLQCTDDPKALYVIVYSSDMKNSVFTQIHKDISYLEM